MATALILSSSPSASPASDAEWIHSTTPYSSTYLATPFEWRPSAPRFEMSPKCGLATVTITAVGPNCSL